MYTPKTGGNINLNTIVKSQTFKENNQITINIAVLGDPRSGKTSLLECFLDEKVEEKNVESVLNIHQKRISFKNVSIDVNFFDISGYFDRDKDLIIDYIKYSNIILLCHSFEQDFNEENFAFWLEQIDKKAESGRNYLYVVGCKYDLKVMSDYQKGTNITTIMFQNGNLASFGERIKTFVNNNMIKDYFLVSSLLNFNVKELFHSVIKDYLYDRFNENNNKRSSKDSQNCLIF